MQMTKRIGLISLWSLVWGSVVVFFAWTIGEIYYFEFLPRIVAAAFAIGYLAGGIFLFWKFESKQTWVSVAAASIVLLYLIGLIQQPRVDRNWDADQTHAVSISISNNDVLIKNFRNNVYRTDLDFDPQFNEFRFELDQLTDVWFLVQRFTAWEGLAHTFLSFQVTTDEGPKYFSVSVEVRREKGETYSPFQGMYRQYELIYTIGGERDLIGVRTVMRPNDRVLMYRANATPEQVQSLFQEIAQRANQLNTHPEYYNTFVNNCTNNIVWHTYKLTPEPINWLDPRIVLPGYSDRFAHAKGLIGAEGQSYQELVKQDRIDRRAREHGLKEGFSTAIRKSSE